MTTEPITKEELPRLYITSENWLDVGFEFHRDGDMCIDLSDESCRECGGRRTYLTQAEAIALRDWLTKVLP